VEKMKKHTAGVWRWRKKVHASVSAVRWKTEWRASWVEVLRLNSLLVRLQRTTAWHIASTTTTWTWVIAA